MQKPLISVVIRSKNEAQTLKELLEKLRQQTIKDIEIILVDNESIDNTKEIARRYRVDKIINISDKEFSHPRSANLGVAAASAPLVVLTNGHCIPMSNTWLADGMDDFKDPKIAGVDGHYTTGRVATEWQKQLDDEYLTDMSQRIEGKHISTTNAIVRKDLWALYPFDETLPECEDYDWSLEMKARGYKIVKDPRLNVFHLHPLSKEQDLKRKEGWRQLCEMLGKRKRPYKVI